MSFKKLTKPGNFQKLNRKKSDFGDKMQPCNLMHFNGTDKLSLKLLFFAQHTEKSYTSSQRAQGLFRAFLQ